MVQNHGPCTTYRHIKQLDSFHLCCLCKICKIKWQNMIPNTEVLSRCKISGMQALLMRRQLRWCGHVARMQNDRIPKAIFYGRLAGGKRSIGAPLKRYKDSLKRHLKLCHMNEAVTSFTDTATNRGGGWRTICCKRGTILFEQTRVEALVEKRRRRKAVALKATD